MKLQFCPRLVSADIAAAAVFGVAPIKDMAEQVALGILRDRRADVSADATVKEGRLVIGVTIDRQAAQHQKAAAVFKLMPDIGQQTTDAWQRKAVTGNCL